jgi:heptosyltransferase-2
VNVLVFNPSFLGDSILTTPLIKLVKRKFPGSKVFFCVRPENVPMFNGLSFVDGVIAFDKRGVHKGVKGLTTFARLLESYHFDYILSCHRHYRTSILMKMLKKPLKIGFSDSKLSIVYDVRVERPPQLAEELKNCALLRPLSDFIEEDIEEPEVTYDRLFYKKISAFLGVITRGSKIVGINPMSVWATKMWPYERFAEVINRLYLEDDIISMVFSGPDEIDIIMKMKSLINVPFINLAGRTSLPELAAYIKYTDLVVTGDSGPMHITRCFKKPMVVIYGATTSKMGFAPAYPGVSILEINGLKCRPCGRHGGVRCPEKHFRCMLDITTDMVVAEIRNLLRRK